MTRQTETPWIPWIQCRRKSWVLKEY